MLQEEFRNLVLGELDAVHRLAFHLVWRKEDAEDLVQETFLRAFKSAASYVPGPRGPRPWLFKILQNALNDRLSAQQRQRALNDGLQQHASSRLPNTQEAAFAEAINWEQVDQRVKTAVADLSLPHRTTFLLCAVEGLAYSEIAEVTGVPVGTVMSRLSRARAILSERLTGVAEERGMTRVDADAKRDTQT